VRDGDKRYVTVQDGNGKGQHVVIVDDLVRSGGTLVEAAKAIKAQGATAVSAFVAHACFSQSDESVVRRFLRGGVHASVFKTFWVTNSIPSVTSKLPKDDCFEVLDLMPQVAHDLEH